MADNAASTAFHEPRNRRSRFRAAAIPLVIFIAIGIMFAVALMSGDPSKLPSALIGKPAPQISLTPLDGLLDAQGRPIPGLEPAALARGKVTVVNFWASWCVPCAQEHPLLGEIAKRTGAELYGVNYKDPNGGGLRFLERLGNPFTAVGVDPKGRAAIEWGVYGMPETFIVDGKGIVVHKHVGPISPQSLERDVIPAIKAAQGS